MTLGPIMVDVAGLTVTDEDRRLIAHPATGGVILFKRNYADADQLRELVAQLHSVKSPAVLVAVDQEGGRVQRIGAPFTALPPLRVIGQRYDRDKEEGLAFAEECGWLMASEMRAAGIDLSFAPVVDIDRGVSDIIGDRAFHRNPDAVEALARAYIKGMIDAGMPPTLKHFPGHGAVALDSHVALPVDRREPDALKRDLMPFQRLSNRMAMGVMTAHVVYTAIDDQPASFSRRWVQGVLRRRCRFQGVVFSDDLSMEGAAGLGSMAERVAAALAAGCDMLPVCNNRAAAWQAVEFLGTDYRNPLLQLRLVRMHGRGGVPLAELRHNQRHIRAVKAVQRDVSKSDDFSLDG